MPRRPLDMNTKMAIIDLYEKGVSMTQIAKELGISKGAVHKVIKAYREGKLKLGSTGEQEEENQVAEGLETQEQQVEQDTERLDSRVPEQDLKYVERFLKLKKNDKLPLLMKQLETQAWWHNLVLDIGRIAVLLSLTTVDIPLDKLEEYMKEWMEDYTKLRDYVLRWLSKTVEARRDAARIMELEEENRILRATVKMLGETVQRLKEGYTIAMSMLPKEKRLQAYLYILLKTQILNPMKAYQVEGVSLSA